MAVVPLAKKADIDAVDDRVDALTTAVGTGDETTLATATGRAVAMSLIFGG